MDTPNNLNGSSDNPPPISLKLEPFVHQVGGHSSMLCLDESTVCKPLLAREKAFYENLPESLKPFTAQYRGSIQVTCTEDIAGYLIWVTTYPPAGYKASEGTQPMKHRIKWHHGMCIEIETVESTTEDDIFEDDTCTTPLSSSPCVEHTPSERRPSHSHNPWILHCHRGHIAKMLGLDADADQHSLSTCNFENLPSFEFLLLENLTWRRKRPCVLDIKMGTRQYGDDAPESKRRSQSLKVENSTSGSLGIRLCGMQVFQVSTNRYLCRNKYYGRSLSDEGLRQSLIQFFHNGERLRTDVFPSLLDRLTLLKAVVSQLDAFRFFTSSLLIIYDGLDPNEIDVRVIDFAHATAPDRSPPTYSGPDDGFIFGLNNLVDLIQELSKEE